MAWSVEFNICLRRTKRPNGLLSKDWGEEADDLVGTIQQFQPPSKYNGIRKARIQKTQTGSKNTNCWRKRGCTSKHLQATAARTVCWRDEISQSWKGIPKNSKLLHFSPFIDQQGLIRAQGIIGKSQLKFKTKHPILFHWKQHVVELFLRNERKNSHHEGTDHVRNIVQQKLWILGIQNALRSIKNKCIRCRKGRAQRKAPVMTDLPEERLVASTVFSNVGVDYFRPFTVKIGQRNEKHWRCLFTCFCCTCGTYRDCNKTRHWLLSERNYAMHCSKRQTGQND